MLIEKKIMASKYFAYFYQNYQEQIAYEDNVV